MNFRKRISPGFDRLDRGGRIAVQERYVFRTVETHGIEALIDASLGESNSLADVEDFQLLANSLYRMNAYSMLLSDETRQWAVDVEGPANIQFDGFLNEYSTPADYEALKNLLSGELENLPLLRPYQSLGVGVGKDENGTYMAIVLIHANSRLAEQNVEALRRRLKESPTPLRGLSKIPSLLVENFDIHNEDRILLAKLYGELDAIALWPRVIFERDALLLYK